MIRTTTGPTLAAALALALAAFFALTALVGAEKITYPSGTTTPKAFRDACLATNGGILTEHKAADGTIKKSSCYHDAKQSSSCDWVEKTCTDTWLEPTSGGVGRVPVDGVLVDDAAGATQPGSVFVGVAAPTNGGSTIIDEP